MEEEPQPEVDNGDDVAMEQDDAHTIAEPEGEIDIDMDGEEEGEVGEEQAQEVQSRTPVLLFGTELYIDPELAHYQQGLRVPIFNLSEPANIIDPSWDYAKYMAFQIVHLMYKYWPSFE